jgi:hypothetical protein
MLGGLLNGQFGFGKARRKRQSLADLLSGKVHKNQLKTLNQQAALSNWAVDDDLDDPFDTIPRHFRVYASTNTAVTRTTAASTATNYYITSCTTTGGTTLTATGVPNPYANDKQDNFLTLRMDDSGKYVYNGGGPIKVNMGYDFKLHLPDGSIL